MHRRHLTKHGYIMRKKIKTVFIGNRPTILESLSSNADIDLVHIFAMKGSMIRADKLKGELSFIAESGEKDQIMDCLLNADYELCVSAGCPYIIPVSECPTGKVFINSHPSALPLGRGKHPINECILSGHNIAGATLHYISDGLDEGPIINQAMFEVTDDIDLDILYSFIFDLECEVFEEGLEKLIDCDLQLEGKPQSGKTTYFSRQNSDFYFDLSEGEAGDLVRKVRAFSSENLGVKVSINGAELTLHRVSRIKNPYLEYRCAALPAGSIALAGNNVLVVKLKDGLVRFERWHSDTVSAAPSELAQKHASLSPANPLIH